MSISPHFSPSFYCGGGYGHVYCGALGRDALYRCHGWQRAAEAMDGRERPIPVSTASRRTLVRNAG